jgi:hypothetical protein
VKIPRADVTVRQHFVDRDRIQRVLDLASPTWQTIIALSRFGGLRCPSEVLSLEWRHIDWLKGEILVQSPKTERYAGMETRKIPLFADLRPYLEDAHHLVEPGQTHVVGGNHLAKAQGQNGWKNCNLRTTFEKLIKRAGVEPWPKLFHNLRSSFETELLRSHPVHVVATWLGHDVDVCIKHYAQITDADYRRANNSAENSALPQAQTAQNRAQQIPAGNSKEVKNVPQSEGSEVFTANVCDSMRDNAQLFSGEGGIRTLVTVSGKLVFETEDASHQSLENVAFQEIEHPSRITRRINPVEPHHAALAVDPDLLRIASVWTTLPPSLKQAIIAIVGTATPSPHPDQKHQPGDELEGPHPAYG